MGKRYIKVIITLALLVSFVLAGCGPSNDLYTWYDYQNAVLEFVKKQTPESEEALIKEYERVVNEQNGTRKTPPPGVCAEYGYLLLKKGKKEEGLALLKQEIALYPESATFIGRIVKQFEE